MLANRASSPFKAEELTAVCLPICNMEVNIFSIQTLLSIFKREYSVDAENLRSEVKQEMEGTTLS